MSAVGIRADELVKRYGEKQVVSHVSLEVNPTEVVGLLGPNGAGKTTTFNMIAGSLRPTEGRVFLGDQEITQLPMYRRARLGITYLPQEASIFRRLSVADNINAILETVEPNRAARKERLKELLSELGLVEKASRRGDALSGGERRRVEITRALVLNPKYMMLDEPFAGVDPIAVIDIQKIIGQLKERGIGVIITDHNVRETLRICDRAYIIKDGHIIRRRSTRGGGRRPARCGKIYLGENFQALLSPRCLHIPPFCDPQAAAGIGRHPSWPSSSNSRFEAQPAAGDDSPAAAGDQAAPALADPSWWTWCTRSSRRTRCSRRAPRRRGSRRRRASGPEPGRRTTVDARNAKTGATSIGRIRVLRPRTAGRGMAAGARRASPTRKRRSPPTPRRSRTSTGRTISTPEPTMTGRAPWGDDDERPRPIDATFTRAETSLATTLHVAAAAVGTS